MNGDGSEVYCRYVHEMAQNLKLLGLRSGCVDVDDAVRGGDLESAAHRPVQVSLTEQMMLVLPPYLTVDDFVSD